VVSNCVQFPIDYSDLRLKECLICYGVQPDWVVAVRMGM
jgi:hypothetical protein